MKKVFGADHKPMWFPDEMSDDAITNIMRGQFPAEPTTTADMDVLYSAGQWARDTGEHLLAIPKRVDDLERSINNWLQGSGGNSPLAQSLGVGDAMKGAGKFLEENVTPKESQLINGVPAPNLEEAQWTGQQIMGDPYQPQTLAGQVTGPILTGATLGLGGGLTAGPKALQLAEKLGPWAGRAAKGAAWAAGAGAGYNAYNKIIGR